MDQKAYGMKCGGKVAKMKDGGEVGVVSKMIEATGRVFGTEKARMIDKADADARKAATSGRGTENDEMNIGRKK